jgi:hypothetical protein
VSFPTAGDGRLADFAQAAADRQKDASLLVVFRRHTAASYFYGIAAEMFLKTAIYSIISGQGEETASLERLRSHLERLSDSWGNPYFIRQSKKGTAWAHDLGFLAQVLLATRLQRRGVCAQFARVADLVDYASGVEVELMHRVERFRGLWSVSLRYQAESGSSYLILRASRSLAMWLARNASELQAAPSRDSRSGEVRG